MAEDGQQYDLLHRGWLMKMGLHHKALRRRFFVLTKDKIAYSKTLKSTRPQGTIPISEVIRVEYATKEETTASKHLLGVSNIF